MEVNFDGITYAKGASVLKQLVAYVGLEHFLAGLRDYFRAHAFGNATFSDLITALEKASGRDLSNWGQQWLKTTGLNTLRPDFDVDADGRFTRFVVQQSGAAPGAGETRVHRLAVASTTTMSPAGLESWCEFIEKNSTSPGRSRKSLPWLVCLAGNSSWSTMTT